MKREDLYPSRFIKAADLQGQEWPVTITRLTMEEIENERGREEKPVLSFQGVSKALVVNVTNFDSIAEMHGEETDNWPGKEIVLFPTTTRFGGKTVDCVRIKRPGPGATKPVVPDPASQAPFDDEIPF